ncbi:MAG: 50S ribosomal protein L23 [Clostridiales bacterium]|jgi:large subunit ribosomal protein L23|nr:50S ribosomal protein L23 [Clostridiales bacterium]
MQSTVYDVIVKPLITEKTMAQENLYAFKVPTWANKIQIKQAIETLFKGVKVQSVHTMNMQGKLKRQGKYVGRRASWKKALVKLTPTSKSIEFFDGLN